MITEFASVLKIYDRYYQKIPDQMKKIEDGKSDLEDKIIEILKKICAKKKGVIISINL